MTRDFAPKESRFGASAGPHLRRKSRPSLRAEQWAARAGTSLRCAVQTPGTLRPADNGALTDHDTDKSAGGAWATFCAGATGSLTPHIGTDDLSGALMGRQRTPARDRGPGATKVPWLKDLLAVSSGSAPA